MSYNGDVEGELARAVYTYIKFSWTICGVANTFKISLKSLLEVEIQTKT